MNANPPREIRCPFCGKEFTEKEEGCKGKCGVMGNCGLICCPRCGYSFVEESRTIKWFRKLWNRNKGKEETP
jgi:uncharacterized C2H2 Zn-finger protein